ncbi:MAG: hypothetical protein WAL69_15535, partial [Candidatus Acidiferrales bacterium]
AIASIIASDASGAIILIALRIFITLSMPRSILAVFSSAHLRYLRLLATETLSGMRASFHLAARTAAGNESRELHFA